MTTTDVSAKQFAGVSAPAKSLPSIGESSVRYAMSWWRALDRERLEFFDPLRIAWQVAARAEGLEPPNMETLWHILLYNGQMWNKAMWANQEQLTRYALDEGEKMFSAWLNTVWNTPGETLQEYMARQASVMEAVANFNELIDQVRDEFGFQLRTSDYRLVGETDSFLMYQVLPLNGAPVRDDLKPMLLVSPYMLGSHILAFLPHENKSYAHAFANAGIPTYVRIVKNIWETEAVQTMTPDDDCLQTRTLCEILKQKHGHEVTLNGTCQGGYICLINILSGRLQGVVDTLITNVMPVDGTFSPAISNMPRLGHDFLMSRLPNGNVVANGYLLSMGMRMVAISRETPLIQVINQARIEERTGLRRSKSVAALFRWLRKERVHLPPAIAEMSSISFEQPVSADGTLPVKLFGKSLNMRDLLTLGVRWYEDYAIKDDLVTPPCATAGNRFVEGSPLFESVAYPGGHVAILTSPYAKNAPVDGRFTDALGRPSRGPVLFQLEISGTPTKDAAPAKAPAALPATKPASKAKSPVPAEV